MGKVKLKGDRKEADRMVVRSERIDDFTKLWNMIYDEVVSYWDDNNNTDQAPSIPTE